MLSKDQHQAATGPLSKSKQEAFCLQYMKDRNATAAYIRASYAVKGAKQNTSRLMANDKVKARISKL
jgi:phage terminase small subunit